MPLLEELQSALFTEVRAPLESWPEQFRRALENPVVRNHLEWTVPPIDDLAHLVDPCTTGRIRAIRLDQFPEVPNLKKPVVAGLLLKEVIQGHLPTAGVTTLVDAGNMNAGFALRYYCEKTGMNGLYVMSRYFPVDVIGHLETDNFRVRQADPADGEIEREFYKGLVTLMQNSAFRADKRCLWHAKYGGAVMYELGREIGEIMDAPPEIVVCSIGSGATLHAIVGMLTVLSGNHAVIVVPEHEAAPVYARTHPTRQPAGVPEILHDEQIMADYAPTRFRNPPDPRIPHLVVGPHYEGKNPFIPRAIDERIDGVQQYTDEEWKRMSFYLERRGLPVGNSSAANLFVASRFAETGKDVLTVIVEPMRSYYKNP